MKLIPLKEWRMNEAKRLGISPAGVNARLYHAKRYPKLRFKRVNKRTVFVVVSSPIRNKPTANYDDPQKA